MYATDNNLNRASVQQAGKLAPTSRDVEITALRFAIHLKRIYERLEMESGPGLRLAEHLHDTSFAISEAIEKAAAQRNPAKAGKFYAEIQQHINKVLHWLHQMEHFGSICGKDLQQVRNYGNVLSVGLAALCAQAGTAPNRQHVRLSDDLSDL